MDRKSMANPYLPSGEYIPDGAQALNFTFEGDGAVSLKSFALHI